MNLAIQDAGIVPEQVEYINAHGTSTDLNDRTETLAIKRSFGQPAYKYVRQFNQVHDWSRFRRSGRHRSDIYRSDSGAWHNPPTVNLDSPDPECDLNYTPNVRSNERRIRYIEQLRIWWAKRVPFVQENLVKWRVL